jgi:hypothetical protein
MNVFVVEYLCTVFVEAGSNKKDEVSTTSTRQRVLNGLI